MNPLFFNQLGNPAAMGGSAPVAPSIALVQQQVATVADGSAECAATFDVPVTGGNSVIACISYAEPSSNGDITIVGGSEEILTQAVISTQASVTSAIYYFHNAGNGGEGIKFTTTLPVRANIHISEWSGMVDAAPEDTSDSTDLLSATLQICPATLDPTTNQNLVIGIGSYLDSSDSYVSGATNSFIRLTPTGGNNVFQECAYLIRAADHAAVTSTVTLNDTLASASCAAGFGGV